VKRRIGGWCEKAASLEVSQLKVSSIRETVKKRGSWKRAAVQRGIGHGGIGISIARDDTR
jgi:hypothetical protein